MPFRDHLSIGERGIDHFPAVDPRLWRNRIERGRRGHDMWTDAPVHRRPFLGRSFLVGFFERVCGRVFKSCCALLGRAILVEQRRQRGIEQLVRLAGVRVADVDRIEQPDEPALVPADGTAQAAHRQILDDERSVGLLGTVGARKVGAWASHSLISPHSSLNSCCSFTFCTLGTDD